MLSNYLQYLSSPKQIHTSIRPYKTSADNRTEKHENLCHKHIEKKRLLFPPPQMQIEWCHRRWMMLSHPIFGLSDCLLCSCTAPNRHPSCARFRWYYWTSFSIQFVSCSFFSSHFWLSSFFTSCIFSCTHSAMKREKWNHSQSLQCNNLVSRIRHDCSTVHQHTKHGSQHQHSHTRSRHINGQFYVFGKHSPAFVSKPRGKALMSNTANVWQRRQHMHRTFCFCTNDSVHFLQSRAAGSAARSLPEFQ